MIDLSALKASFSGKPVAVMGLARSGMAALAALQAAGIDALAWDDNEACRNAAAAKGYNVTDLAQADFGKIAALVLAPGIPLTHPEPNPVAKRAKEAGVEIIGDIELLRRALPDQTLVAITGTNGKSTTTALIGHVLNAAGRKALVGGNIGTAVLELAPPDTDDVLVLELSSYQLDLTPSLNADIAVLLNISPDHLDRHGGMDGYVAAKKRVFDGAIAAVIGVDDEHSREIYHDLCEAGPVEKVIPVSVHARAPGGSWVEGGNLYNEGWIVDLSHAATLPGAHNWQNAAAACAVVRLLGVEPARISPAILSFSGLAHRQQLVGARGNIRFINDSKATNAEAAAKALGCYENIYWIVGGRAKDGGLAGLEPYMAHVRHAYLIGEAAQDFAAWLADQKVPHTNSGTLDKAVLQACNDIGDDKPDTAVVLLSPACASFDQFESFEARGDAFVAAVAEAGMQKGGDA